MSGGGLAGLGGDVGAAGRMKWGRCEVDGAVAADAATEAMLGKCAGVRDAGGGGGGGGATLNRCVVELCTATGVEGSACCRGGELGVDMRSRLLRVVDSNSISSSSLLCG